MVTAVTSLGRSGVADWLIQRVTALVLVAYVIFIVGALIGGAGASFAEWSALFSKTWVRVFSLAAIVSTAAHAWIGLWVVATDYLTEHLMGGRAMAVRLVFQAVVAITLFIYVVWGIQILWA